MTRAPYIVPDDDQTPYPVEFDRVLRVLHSLGFRVDTLVDGRAAGAVLDQIPFLFSFDSADRFLSVRAVWDTGLDPQSCAQALFAAADGWNREKYLPTVYRTASDEGTAQICADYAIDTLAGLTDSQLADNLSAGISTGLSAMEYMKQAARQTVGWSDAR